MDSGFDAGGVDARGTVAPPLYVASPCNPYVAWSRQFVLNLEND